jgi:hypothetical protein
VTYITVEEAREYARTEVDADAAQVDVALLAACRDIDNWCQRTFTVPTSATPRLFTPQFGSSLLRVDDIANTTNLVVVDDGATLAAASYQLEVSPGQVNQATRTGESWPYGWIRLLDHDWWTHDAHRATVSVTARWGWPATPDAVKLAARILTRDYLMARDVRFGIAQFGADGFTRRVGENATVAALLAPYRAVEAWGFA